MCFSVEVLKFFATLRQIYKLICSIDRRLSHSGEELPQLTLYAAFQATLIYSIAATAGFSFTQLLPLGFSTDLDALLPMSIE